MLDVYNVQKERDDSNYDFWKISIISSDDIPYDDYGCDDQTLKQITITVRSRV